MTATTRSRSRSQSKPRSAGTTKRSLTPSKQPRREKSFTAGGSDPKSLSKQTGPPPGLNVFKTIGLLSLSQFPLVLIAAMLSPFYFHSSSSSSSFLSTLSSWNCDATLDVCSRCHHTAYPIVPLSLSGIVADDDLLQSLVFSTFVLAFSVYFLINALLVPLSSAVAKQFCSTAATMFSFYCCIFVFPLRNGCEQTVFHVISHLTFLLLSIAFAAVLFSCPFTSKPPSKTAGATAARMQAAFTATLLKLCVAATLTSALGTVFWAGQIGFLFCEVLMCFMFSFWGALQLSINVDENPSLSEFRAKVAKWAEIAAYFALFALNVGSVSGWLGGPFV